MDLVFLPYEGSKNQFNIHDNYVKNRQAQIGKIRPERNKDTDVSHVEPRQIRFRAEGVSTLDNNVEVRPTTRVLRRCYSCRRRRMLTRLTCLCLECERGSVVSLSDISGYATLFASSTAQERSMLHYFYNSAAVDISGYLPGRFWDGLVLQLAQAEETVRQAVLATASAHREYSGESSLRLSANTLAIHQSALRKLREYMHQNDYQKSRDLVLLCSVLLHTFARLTDDPLAATVHLKSAMTILNTTRAASTSDLEREPFQSLRSWLIQMDIEATMQDLDSGPNLRLDDCCMSARYIQDGEVMKMVFHTAHETHEPWMFICHDMWRFVGENVYYRHRPLHEVPQSVLQRRTLLQALMQEWRRATDDYLRKHPPPNIDVAPSAGNTLLARRVLDIINMLVLESHYYVVKCILIESITDDAQSLSNPFDEHVELLISAARQALTYRQAYKRMHALDVRTTFSPHVGIVESLFCFAHRTVSPDIRARLQHLIREFSNVQNTIGGDDDSVAGYGTPPSDLVLIYELPGH